MLPEGGGGGEQVGWTLCLCVQSQWRLFGTRGSGQGQLAFASGVAVDGEGNVLVADYAFRSLQQKAGFSQHVGKSRGSGHLQFDYSSDIAANALVYVTDTLNHCVQVLNSDLTYSSTIGKEGSGTANSYPWGIA